MIGPTFLFDWFEPTNTIKVKGHGTYVGYVRAYEYLGHIGFARHFVPESRMWRCEPSTGVRILEVANP